MANSNFAGSFAMGLVNGYVKGKEQQQQQERNALEIDKLKADKAMREAFKAVDQNVSPTEAYSVPMADGSTASAATLDAAKELAGPNVDPANISKVFLVGGKQYASKDLADDAASAMNSPAARMRRQADIARQFGRPDIASSLAQSYKSEIDANRQVVFDNFNNMRTAGDTQGIIDMYNNRPGARGKVSMVQGADGSVTLSTRNGDTVTPGPTYKSVNDFYDAFGNMLSATPDNVFERSLANKKYGLAERSQAEQERHNQVSEGISAANASTAARGVGLREEAYNSELDAQRNPQAKTRYIRMDDGGVGAVTETSTYDPSKGWFTSVSAPVRVPGAKYDNPHAGVMFPGITPAGPRPDYTPSQSMRDGRSPIEPMRNPAASGIVTPADPRTPPPAAVRVDPATGVRVPASQ